jgi:D-aminopeptidase
MTGTPWIDESGMLGSTIDFTYTHQVGMVRDALVRYAVEHRNETGFILPVAAETYDGWLSDAGSFPLKESDAFAAVDVASGGAVAEGNVGGGTGMICHEFKGGTGTSSRVIDLAMHSFTVGVLVQANYGSRPDLRIDGVPVGRHLGYDRVPAPWPAQERDGSIIVVIATDAPMLATQCSRLARRATVGLARVGGVGHNGSGDLFVAFATGNRLSGRRQSLRDLKMLPDEALDRFFVAVADATEEAIVNALCAAETMTGYRGRTAHALPVEEVTQILRRYRDL